MTIQGDDAHRTISAYLESVAPDLLERVGTYTDDVDPFDAYRITEQIEKALDRKVWLPSGGSLVIDRTEAMTVIDVNTGKFVGTGGNLEETVTKNNLEAAEEIVRQLRLRDVGGIIVVDFIDMVLESNRDLVLRRLVECLSRDRTKHQVAEVTSLGLVQMTRKKLGLGLLETFSEACEVCAGRGVVVHHDPVIKHRGGGSSNNGGNRASLRGGSSSSSQQSAAPAPRRLRPAVPTASPRARSRRWPRSRRPRSPRRGRGAVVVAEQAEAPSCTSARRAAGSGARITRAEDRGGVPWTPSWMPPSRRRRGRTQPPSRHHGHAHGGAHAAASDSVALPSPDAQS